MKRAFGTYMQYAFTSIPSTSALVFCPLPVLCPRALVEGTEVESLLQGEQSTHECLCARLCAINGIDPGRLDLTNEQTQKTQFLALESL